MTQLQSLTNDILNIRQPKQTVDQIIKTILFIRTRKCIIHPNEYEKTPSVKLYNMKPLDELIQRGRVVELARIIVENLTGSRRYQGSYDEKFNEIKPQVIYTANNFINCYFNSHGVNSVESIDLAIVAVFLSCKINSTFKRLEKIIITARSCFKSTRKLDKTFYATIEMMILQSLGFELSIVDDIPHRYIYQFMPIMKEKFKSFKFNDKKMKFICTSALSFATSVVNSTPIMINRDSCLVAAACLYISNSFKSFLNISDWWKHIPGCQNFTEKNLTDTADLVFDVIKYSQNNWQSNTNSSPLQTCGSPNSSHSTSGIASSNGSSPSHYLKTKNSPAAHKVVNKMLLPGTSPSINLTKLGLNKSFLKNSENEENFSGCDSESNISGCSSQKSAVKSTIGMQSTASNSSITSIEGLSNDSFSKPSILPDLERRKSQNNLCLRQYMKHHAVPSPVIPKSTRIYQETNAIKANLTAGSPRPNLNCTKLNVNLPSNSETILTNVVKYNHTPKKRKYVENVNRENSDDKINYNDIKNSAKRIKKEKKRLKDDDLEEKRKRKQKLKDKKRRHDDSLMNSTISDLDETIMPKLASTPVKVDKYKYKRKSISSCSDVGSIASDCSSSSFLNLSGNVDVMNSQIMVHPLESTFKSKKEAILKSKDVACFYAKSNKRYKTLPRELKDIVKQWVKKIKSKNLSSG